MKTNSSFLYIFIIASCFVCALIILDANIGYSQYSRDDYYQQVQRDNQTTTTGKDIGDAIFGNPDFEQRDRIESFITSPIIRLFSASLIFLTTLLSYFSFHEDEKTYALFLFSIYSGLSQALIYNFIYYFCSDSFPLYFAFVYTISGLLVGLLSSVFILSTRFAFKTIIYTLEGAYNTFKEVFEYFLITKYNPSIYSFRDWIICVTAILSFSIMGY
ncbi:MAG: hypothetical protein NTV87_15700 [Ignavibacteriae bacterium]|nr:hypothetical protein [Ignavibacteriota bacterium]